MCDKNEILATVKAANEYLQCLHSLNDEIEKAQHQIKTTSNETQNEIDKTFQQLLETVTKVLLERRDLLLKQVVETKNQSLKPLEECRNDIKNRMNKTDKLINEARMILSNGTNLNIDDFSNKSSLLGSLPVIPELKEVPYLTFLFHPNLESELIDICSQIGEVSRIAPVQISQTTEKPGAILVEWQGVDGEERSIDIQEYRLQKAFGNVLQDKDLHVNFLDYYKGPDTQCLVKDLNANQMYSFRVCCKFEGSSEWSPWSIAQTASTSISPFSWAENEDFILADQNRIAIPVKELPSILLSNGPQFRVGYSVEFTFLEFDGNESALGLIASNNIDNSKKIKLDECNNFIFNSNGEIIVNGVKKSTKLPQVAKGLKVCFTCEEVTEDKVRVNVDSCNKQVTYDWHISSKDKLYFIAKLNSPKSKIMVE